ncbi:MAG: hypothetical protein E6Q97_06870 [Desulfurellales bacterium]|nr:MAG: hypothetical protein E6Q97_06870 [Desulfurellales bacterium]
MFSVALRASVTFGIADVCSSGGPGDVECPPTVSFGAIGRQYFSMTPDEARRIANALEHAADMAEVA